MSDDKRVDLPGASANNFSARVREVLQTYLGRQGDPLDRGLTLRDLIENGIVELRGGTLPRPGGRPGLALPPGIGGGSGKDGLQDLTPPPTPTGFAAVPMLTAVQVKHDAPVYQQGGGHKRSHLYGAIYNGTGAQPTFADAKELSTFFGSIHSFVTNPSTQWHLWLKWESNAGVLSVDPAGGQNGLVAVTGVDVNLLLDTIAGLITSSELSKALNDRIDLVDGPQTLANSVAYRVKAETDARVAAIQAETTARNTAIQAETTARQQAISDEVAARNAAIQVETAARQQAITDEVAARNTAITTQVNSSAATLRTEITNSADTVKTTLRSEFAAADGDTLTQAQSYVNSYTYSKSDQDRALAGAIEEVVSAFERADDAAIAAAEAFARTFAYSRSDADSAEAAQNITLQARWEEADTANAAQVTQAVQANLDQNYYTRAGADSAIAAATLELNASIGKLFTPMATYDQPADKARLGTNNAGLTDKTGAVLLTPTTSDPMLIVSPTASFKGSDYDKVRVRLRKVGGLSNPNWQGTCYYSIPGRSYYTEEYRKTIPKPAKLDAGVWLTLEWDMADLTAGGDDWSKSTIETLRLDFSDALDITYEIDWVAIGRDTPPVSDAELKRIDTATADNTASIASTATTLRTEFNAGDASTLTSAKSHSESYSYSKSQADSAIATSGSNLRAEFQAADTTTLNSAKGYTDSYAYSKSAADAAIAVSSDAVRTEFAAADAAVESKAKSYVEQYAYSKSDADGALAAAAQELVATFERAVDDAKTQANAYTTSFSYSRSDADAAVAAQGLALEAAFLRGDADAKADLEQNYYTRASADGAIASSETKMRAEWKNDDATNLTSAKAYTDSYAYSKAGADAAIAAKGDSLKTEWQADDATNLTSAKSYTDSYAYSKSATDGAISAAGNSLRTEWQGNDATNLASAKSYTETYAYSKSATDGAISTAGNALRTEWQGNDATNLASAKAYTDSYAYSKSAADAAIAVSSDAVRTEFAAADAAVESKAKSYVEQYAYSKSDADSSISSVAQELVSTFERMAGDTLAASQAYVNNYSYSKADADGASAAQTLELRSEYQKGDQSLTATLENNYYTKANADAAVSGQITTFGAKVQSRGNLLPNGGFEQGTDGWELSSGHTWQVMTDGWGRHLNNYSIATSGSLLSKKFPINGDDWYTIAGDSLLFDGNSQGSCYFDLLFYNNVGNLILTGNGKTIAGAHDFQTGSARRYLHEAETRAPSTATHAAARFVWSGMTAPTVVGVRQIKVERGQLPSTPYTPEGSLTEISAALKIESEARADQTGKLFGKHSVNIDLNGYVTGYGLTSEITAGGQKSSTFIANVEKFAVTTPTAAITNWQANTAVALYAMRGIPGNTDKVLVCKQAGTTSGTQPSMGSIGDMVTDGGVKWQVGSRVPFSCFTTSQTVNGVTVPVGTYMDGAYLGNATIQSATIANLAVQDGHIVELRVDKLTAGSIKIDTYIQSTGYVAGSTGWRIHGDGTAEFAAASIRGKLIANQIQAVDSATIQGKLTANQIDAKGLVITDSAGNTVLGAGEGASALRNDMLATGSNLLYNADFAHGRLAGWTPATATGGVPATSADDINTAGDAWVINGGNGDSTNTIGIRQIGRVNIPSAYHEVTTDMVPFPQNTRLIASIYSGAHRCKVGIGVYCYKVNGDYVGPIFTDGDLYNDETHSGGQQIGGYKRIYVYGDTPAETAQVKVFIRKYDTKPDPPGFIHTDSWGFFARAMLEIGRSATTTPSIWALGNNTLSAKRQITASNASTFIADAAIGSAHINDLSADKITAGTITSQILITNGAATFKGVLQAANFSVGEGSNGGTFSDPTRPSVALRSSAMAWADLSTDYTTTVVTDNNLAFGSVTTDIPTLQRIRTGTVNFLIIGTAQVEHFLSIWYRLRNSSTDGWGAWTYLSHAVEFLGGQGTVAIQRVQPVTLSPDAQIQYGMAPLDQNGNLWTGAGDPYMMKGAFLSAAAINF